MNPQVPREILNDNHFHQINAALEAAKLVQAHLDQAKMAGFDTSAHQTSLENHVERLRKIKNVYFPGR